jgi:alanine-synthesizing transaminase
MYSSFPDEILTCSIQQKIHEAKIKHIAAGKELCDLSMINPDIAPARILIDKLVEASVKTGSHRYSVSKGIKKLRMAFAEKYSKTFSVKVNPETHICITMGTKDALVNALAVVAGQSKNVLLPSPTYPAHLSAAEIAGLKPIFYDICRPEDQILSDIDSKIKSHGCKIIITNFPNNPTGIVVSQNFYSGLKSILQGSNVIVINDFVYGEMGFAAEAQPSLLSIFGEYEYLLETYSLSKAYSIPGWRIAAAIGNEKIIERLVRLKSHIDYGIFLPLQIAACSALQNSQIAADSSAKFKKRHKLLAGNLSKLKWEVLDSSAGAALWAKIPRCYLLQSGSSMNFCLELLQAKGILLTPGIVFGKEYDDFVRIALVASEEKLYEISKSIAQFQSVVENNLKSQNAA